MVPGTMGGAESCYLPASGSTRDNPVWEGGGLLPTSRATVAVTHCSFTVQLLLLLTADP